MMGYEQSLHTAIAQAMISGEETTPELLLRHLSTLDDPIAAANDFDGTNDLFATLEQEFASVRHKQHANLPTTGESFGHLVGLIRWLRAEIEQLHNREPSGHQLIAYLTTAAFIDHGRLFWCELPLRPARCQGFFAVLGSLIEKANTRLNLRGVRVPIWEQETLDLFNAADAKGDFIEIDKLWSSIESSLMPSFLLHQVVLCLAYNKFQFLVKTSNVVEQTLLAMWIADALPSTLCYQLAFESTSRWVRFSCLYCSLRKSRRRHGFHRNARRLLVSTLGKLALDNEMWVKVMAVFNKYPVRYPALQPILGKALAQAPQFALDVYIDAIELGISTSGREEISACLRSFRSSATREKRRELFIRCYRRWQTFMEVKPSESLGHFDIFVTALDYGVIAYLSEFVGHEEIKTIIESICNQINELSSCWYPSETDCMTAFNVLLSRLQPYYRALGTDDVTGDFLTNKICLPRKLVQNRYVQLMYGCRWEKHLGDEK